MDLDRANLDGHQNVFARLEWVRKSGHALVLPAALDGTYAIASLAGGYLYDFGPFFGVSPGVGARVAVELVPEALSAEYGGRLPIGGMIYLRLTPPAGHGAH